MENATTRECAFARFFRKELFCRSFFCAKFVAMKNLNINVRVNRDAVLRALTAERVLEKLGIGLIDAVRLVSDFAETGKTKRPERLRRIFLLGCKAFENERRSLEFFDAFEKFLEAKSHLRERTLRDYRQIVFTIFKKNPHARTMKVSAVSVAVGRRMITDNFRTPRQRDKASAILHAFFSFAEKFGWCCENPIPTSEFPLLAEREIVPLSVDETERLLRSAKKNYGGECLPAVALMLFAGIRPREAERLRWSDIDWEEKVISVGPTHSKTGGIRHVSILPRLEKILRATRLKNSRAKTDSICPANWIRKWRNVRASAGWTFPERPWQQDVLRHTFASYHLKFFKNLPLLQCEMGHSSARLLRTRYLSMRGITGAAAAQFWCGK